MNPSLRGTKQSADRIDCFVPRNDGKRGGFSFTPFFSITNNLITLFTFFLFSVLIGCDTAQDDRTAKQRSEHRHVGPQFKKEGELYLIRASGDTIRKIDIEIADIESERTIGLMYRRSMPDTEGMLFIFEKEKPRSFWMRNTLIGLDILYIRGDGQIESIAKYCIPKYEKSIPSTGPALYVLEVIEGFCDIYNVREGDRIDFKRTDGK